MDEKKSYLLLQRAIYRGYTPQGFKNIEVTPLVKKFNALYGNPTFIITIHAIHTLVNTLSTARNIQSTSSRRMDVLNPKYSMSISGQFPVSFCTKIMTPEMMALSCLMAHILAQSVA
jgi:hypothetical protein